MNPLRHARGGADVADDLAAEIAAALAEAGEYVVRIAPLPTQQMVDLHWAAHQAGRRLGLQVAVAVRTLKGTDTRVEVRVGPRRRGGVR